jgi:hypothetical protein
MTVTGNRIRKRQSDFGFFLPLLPPEGDFDSDAGFVSDFVSDFVSGFDSLLPSDLELLFDSLAGLSFSAPFL